MDLIEFRKRLVTGEKLLWSGQPQHGVFFGARDLFLVPFSLFWCGFAIFWRWTAASTGAPSFFLVVGFFFVCSGLFFVLGRFLADAWLRKRTYYAITDSRALILRNAPFASFTAVDLAKTPQVEMVGNPTGRASIVFGPSTSIFGANTLMWGPNMLLPSLDPVPQFIKIQNAAAAYDLITKLRREVGSGKAPGSA